MLAAGTRDWVEELGIHGVVEVLDTGMDPVRIVTCSSARTSTRCS